jgi:hypothetical protein
MTTTLKQTNNIKNGLVGSTVTFPGSNTTGITTTPIPPLTVGQVYTTSGTSGQFLTSVSNGTSWTTPSTQFNNSNGKAIMTVPNGKDEIVLEKDATLTVKGKVVINDRDLEERLNTIEKVLQIPERDVKLEKKHPKLKKLYDEYINELSKYKMWQSIKGDND